MYFALDAAACIVRSTSNKNRYKKIQMKCILKHPNGL